MLVKFPDNLWFSGETPLEPGLSTGPADVPCAKALKANGLDNEDGVTMGVFKCVGPGR